MAIPTIEWDEGNPSGAQAKSLGAQRIRELKTQFREIFNVDHNMSSFGSGNSWGYHDKCTFYNRSSDSIPDTDTGCLYTKNYEDKSALYWIDENLDWVQLISSKGFVGGMTSEVRIWKGLLADIPVGWSLCDGTGTTPNLVGKFIRGINTSTTDPGGTGGSDTVTLVTANLPAHTHTSSTESGHYHGIKYTWRVANGEITLYGVDATVAPYYAGIIETGGGHNHTANSTGNGELFDNRPAYLENAFIIKT